MSPQKNAPIDELLRMAARGRLARKIERLTESEEVVETAVQGLTLSRRSAPTPPVFGIYETGIALIVQGAKLVTLGEDVLTYDRDHFLITSLDLPLFGQVTEASIDCPYLSLMLLLDEQAILDILLNDEFLASSASQPRRSPTTRAMATGRVTGELFSAFERLVDLLESTPDIPALAPLIQREILYRLMTGEQGGRLRQIGAAGSHSAGIARAIRHLKANFAATLRINELAEDAAMSVSTFHSHFRSMTTMSPLQYQKQLRLHEARRLLLTFSMDSATAAFQVGYESPSQFSREYSRLFGAPPKRDVATTRNMQSRSK